MSFAHAEPGTDDARALEECLRVARRLMLQGPAVVGLVPAGPVGALPAFGVSLGLALAAMSGERVAWIDGLPPPSAPRTTAANEGPPQDADADPPVSARERTAHLTVLTVRPRRDARGAAETLVAAIAHAQTRFPRVLVDLSGAFPEYPALQDHTDGFLLVATAGRTREKDLRELHDLIPSRRNLGVVLVG